METLRPENGRQVGTFRHFLTGSILLLFFFVAGFIYRIGEMQRIYDALEVIQSLNYDAQRLVKLEIAGEFHDRYIEELDQQFLLLGESIWEGGYGLMSLNSYQTLLSAVLEDWVKLKQEIVLARPMTWEKTLLLYQSEQLYQSSTAFHGAVTAHYHSYSNSVELTQQCIVLNMTFTFLLLLSQGIAYFQLEQKNKEISQIMYQDLHTGLNNKSRCEALLEEYDTLGACPLAVVMVFDLNDLKKVNDQLGHSSGDEMIRGFAECLTQAGAHLSEEIFLGRYGGDEFLLFLSESHGSSVDEFLTFLDHYVKLFNDCVEGYGISYARGYASRCEFSQELSLRDLLHHADKAMYLHKVMVKESMRKGRKESS